MDIFLQNISGIIIDKNFNIIHFGSLAKKILLYDNYEIGNLLLILESSEKEIKNLVSDVYKNKEKIYNLEIVLKNRRGIKKDIELSASFLLNKNIEGIILNLFDISLRKRIESTFLESQNRYNVFFENGNDAVFIFQIDENFKTGNFMEINHKASEISKYSKIELMSMNFKDIFNEVKMESVFNLILKQKHLVYETFLCNKNSEKIPVEINASIVGFKEQNTILIFARDITERKRIDESNKKHLLVLKNTLSETVNAIAAMTEQRDPYTAGHQQRVSKLAKTIAKGFGMSESKIEAIKMAGLLHDIGKIAIPGELLTKPGRLSDIEMELIKIHPLKSYEIIKDIPFNEPISEIVKQHHERLDGSGYPEKLVSEEILFESKIISVADVVEAMSSHRPYRPALGLDIALEEIKNKSGIFYDPEIVKMCIKVFLEDGFTFEE